MILALRKHIRDVVALVVLAAIGLGTGYYILQEQGFRIPVIEEQPFEIKAAFTDAGGVKPGQNQAVRMAGVRIGEISGADLEDGRAILTLAIEPRYADRIRSDATGLLRPRTGLEDMFVDLGPGSEDAPPIEEGALIRVGRTLPDVDSEQILEQLDEHTQDYLKILINAGAEGIDGRSEELRRLYKALGPLHRDLERVNRALANQRGKLRRLVRNYGQITTELAKEPQELTALVDSSAAVFEAFASQDADISAAIRRLPGALRQTDETLEEVDRFADVLGPTLEDLRPAFRELDDANEDLRRLARDTTGTVRTQIRPFIRRAQPYLETVEPAAENLADALPELTGAFGQLNRLANMAAFNPNGAEEVPSEPAAIREREEGYLFWLGWLAHNTNSLFSTSDASGAFRRAFFAFDCTSIRQLVGMEPILGEVFGVTNVLASTTLCPTDPADTATGRRTAKRGER